MITKELLGRAMNYNQYRELLDKLLAEGKTTGENQTEENINYAKINRQRMQRLDKTTRLTEEMRAALTHMKRNYIWLVLTEGWCGDAAQSVPVMAQIEKEFPSITLLLLLRDENPELMNRYLTNGAKSIPKLVCLEKETLKEIFTWGPRPAKLQTIVIDLLSKGVSKSEKGLAVQHWYNNDKTLTIQHELATLVRQHCTGALQ